MRTKFIAILMLIAVPLAIYAEIITVGTDTQTIQEAVYIAEDGDTLVVPEEDYLTEYDPMGKDLEVVVDAIEPPDAPHDSSVYGPKDYFPQTPVE